VAAETGNSHLKLLGRMALRGAVQGHDRMCRWYEAVGLRSGDIHHRRYSLGLAPPRAELYNTSGL